MLGSGPSWTVAVHLAGGKNLTEQMVRALQEMRDEVNSGEGGLRIVAQFEPQGRLPRAFAFGLDDTEPPFALPFLPSPNRALMSPALTSFEYMLDSSRAKPEELSSATLLAGFVETGKATSSGGPFMLVISGHGNGAVGPFLAHREPGAELGLLDLPAVFDSADISNRNKIDVLGLDCCTMSMVEVGYELAPYARFLVASEGDVSNHGWPYRQILGAIREMRPADAANEIVRQFARFYFDYRVLGISSHCAVCDLDQMDRLTEPLRELADTLTARIHEPGVWQPLVLAHWEAQSYKDEEYVDLADFCDRLAQYLPDPCVQDCCSAVIDAVAEVVNGSYMTGTTYQYSTGLSVYFPWSNDAAKGRGREIRTTSDLEGYKMLTFSKKTQWGDFLDAYLEATQRKPGFEKEVVQPLGEVLAVRRTVPFGRGGQSASTRFKNHPANSTEIEPQAVRRTVPFGRGDNSRRTSIKNHSGA